MKQLTKEELQGSQLGILSYIDKICKENNIKYFIHYGSMLGAVRHKGFIPWDDDIDIGMYREDYERLKAAIIKDKMSATVFLIKIHVTGISRILWLLLIRILLSKTMLQENHMIQVFS